MEVTSSRLEGNVTSSLSSESVQIISVMPGETKRSPSRTLDGDYSDSFESADEDFTPTPKPKVTKMSRKPVSNRPGRISPSQLDQVARRMLSARRRRINDLTSQMNQLEKQLADALSENKTLKKQNFRQEKALDKIDHSQSELPSLLERHYEEVRSLKEQLKRFRERSSTDSCARKDAEADVAKLKRQLIRLKELTEDRSLPERDVLRREVNSLKDEIERKDKKIQELERKLELLQKNHKVELVSQVSKYKESQMTIEELQEKLNIVENQIREKDKVLEIQNIYCQRVMRPPHRLDTASSTHSSINPFHFPSVKNGKDNRSSEAHNELTPRERIKQFEEKRRFQLKKKIEEKQKMKQRKVNNSHDEQIGIIEDPSEDQYDFAPETNTSDVYSIDPSRMVEEENEVETNLIEDEEGENAKRIEEQYQEEERLRIKKESERNRIEGEEKRRRQQQLKTKEKMEREQEEQRLREMNALQQAREEKERQRREEAENKERIRREQAEIEERLKREQDDIEEEQKRIQAAVEEKKRKELLSKLSEIDQNNQMDGAENQSQKSNLSKRFSFTESVENMHKGKPSTNDYPVPPYLAKRRESEEKRLMTDLFGTNTAKSEENDDIFDETLTLKKESSQDSRRLAVVQPRRSDGARSMHSGSSGRPSDIESNVSSIDSIGNKLLPKRGAQPKSILRNHQAPPGAIDDEIEELIL